MTKNTDGDNWGQLLSDFGIEDHAPEEAAQETVPPEAPQALPEPVDGDGFGIGVAESGAEETDPSTPKERKSIFSRFPKVNFFGAPPDISLDSVMEGTKSPTLGKRAFIDNTLEKMPISQERKDRQKRDRNEQEPAGEPDAWSTVASQIGTLASGEDARMTGERPARRVAESMFDDPLPESEEVRALKDLMGEQPRHGETRRRETRREESCRDTFHEEEPDTRNRGRGRRKPPMEEREERGETRGRGARYRPPVETEDLPESDFEMVDDGRPPVRGRGQRGSRYSGGGYRDREPVREEPPQEEWSEIDAALQAEAGRGASAPRGGRQQRYDHQRRDQQRHDKRRRPEWTDEPTIERQPLDSGAAANNIASIHGDIPSWDDAVGDIIAGNIARHRAHSGKGRR